MRSRGGGESAFKFEASLLSEEMCGSIVSDAWAEGGVLGEGSVVEKLKHVVGSLQSWSVNVLGDLQKRIKKIKKELERFRRLPINEFSVQREAVLSYRLDKVEEQVDIFWRQRAHTNWLNKGDRNTAFFFHKWCSEMRRMNKIGRLRKEDGGWVC